MRPITNLFYFLLAAKAVAQCPDESWTPAAAKCYKLSAVADDWSMAGDLCTAQGAQIASITSAAEADAVFACGTPPFWTGLNDLATEGTWTWRDGASTDYINSAALWSTSQPNDYLGQDCVAISTGGLDDQACTLPRAACCVYVPSPSPTPSQSSSQSLTATRTQTKSSTETRTPSKSQTATRTPSKSLTPSQTASASITATPGYTLLADSSTDFSTVQNNNGWTYGYFLGTSRTRTLATYNSGLGVFTYLSSYCRLSGTYLHPNTGGDCSTPSFGLCKPSVRWNNAESTYRSEYKIVYTGTNARACGDGITTTLYVNDIAIATDSNSAGGALSASRTVFTEAVDSVELRSDPGAGCNCDQLTYLLRIYAQPFPPSPSITPTISDSPSVSPSPSISTSASPSASETPSATVSSTVSPSLSPTASVSMGSTGPLQDFVCSGTQTHTSGLNYRTTAAGTTYTDNFACTTYVQAPAGRALLLTTLSVDTEPCCDFFTVYDGLGTAGTMLLRTSGTSVPAPIYSSGTSLTVIFTTDYSIIATGIAARIEVVAGSPTPTSSRSATATRSLTGSPSSTATESASDTTTATATRSQTISKSPSTSSSPSVSTSASITSTITNSPSVSQSPSLSPSQSPSASSSASQSVSSSASPSVSPSESSSSSASLSVSTTSTPGKSWSMTASLTTSSSLSPTQSPSESATESATTSPSETAVATVSSSPTPTATYVYSFSATTTRTATGSPTRTQSPSPTPSKSTSQTRTWTPGRSSSPTPSKSPSRSPSISRTPSKSRSPTRSASISQTTTISGSPSATATSTITGTTTQTISITSSVSLTPTTTKSTSVSVSQSISASATATSTITETGSCTGSASPSTSKSMSASSSPSSSASQTLSPTRRKTSSPTISGSASVSQSISISPSISGSSSTTITTSPSASVSVSLSVSPSITTTITVSPLSAAQAAAALPLTSFTDDAINGLLANILIGPVGEAPPYERIAAGFFATNPDATEATFRVGNLTVLLARVDVSTSQSLGPAELPPFPGAPSDAVGFVAAQPFSLDQQAANNLTGRSISIGLTAADGTEISVSGLADPIVISFGANTTTLECVFYDTTAENWSTDGCQTVNGSCVCTHLTEFGMRFRAIADVNAGIFNSLGRLGTIAGMLAALPVIILIAAIGASLIVVIIVLNALDKQAFRRYAEQLDASAEFELIRDKIGLGYESWDRLAPKGRCSQLKAGLEAPVPPTVPTHFGQLLKYWLLRLPFDHPWLGIFLRFNPMAPRIYRGILISCGILTSVAISILFYGYKNGAGAAIDAPLEISETIVLSLITTAVAMPVSTVISKMATFSGSYEFRARYPNLSAELTKVRRFLQIAKQLPRDQLRAELADYERRLFPQAAKEDDEEVAIYDDFTDTSSTPSSSAPTDTAATLSATLGADAGIVAGTLLITTAISCIWSSAARQQLCCPERRQRFRRGVLQFIQRYSHVHAFRSRGGSLCGPVSLPIHTPISAVLTGLLFLWMAGCSVYILGFTSYKAADATLTIFKSVAISQATSILIVNPAMQLFALIVPYLRNRNRDPEEAIFYPLELFLYKAETEFVAQASLVPCIGRGSAVRALTVIPADQLVRRIETVMSPEDQRLEARIQTIFWAID